MSTNYHLTLQQLAEQQPDSQYAVIYQQIVEDLVRWDAEEIGRFYGQTATTLRAIIDDTPLYLFPLELPIGVLRDIRRMDVASFLQKHPLWIDETTGSLSLGKHPLIVADASEEQVTGQRIDSFGQLLYELVLQFEHTGHLIAGWPFVERLIDPDSYNLTAAEYHEQHHPFKHLEDGLAHVAHTESDAEFFVKYEGAAASASVLTFHDFHHAAAFGQLEAYFDPRSG